MEISLRSMDVVHIMLSSTYVYARITYRKYGARSGKGATVEKATYKTSDLGLANELSVANLYMFVLWVPMPLFAVR